MVVHYELREPLVANWVPVDFGLPIRRCTNQIRRARPAEAPDRRRPVPSRVAVRPERMRCIVNLHNRLEVATAVGAEPDLGGRDLGKSGLVTPAEHHREALSLANQT